MTDKTQAALDEFEQMLSFIALSHSYWGTCDKDFISDFAVNTIRAALSQDVNAELLEACKVALGHMTGGMDGYWEDCDPIVLLRQAIARAEKKGSV